VSAFDPSYSPDGRHLAWVEYREAPRALPHIFIGNPSGRGGRRLTAGSEPNSHPMDTASSSSGRAGAGVAAWARRSTSCPSTPGSSAMSGRPVGMNSTRRRTRPMVAGLPIPSIQRNDPKSPSARSSASLPRLLRRLDLVPTCRSMPPQAGSRFPIRRFADFCSGQHEVNAPSENSRKSRLAEMPETAS